MDQSPLSSLAPFPQFLLFPVLQGAVFQVTTAYLRKGSHSLGSSPEIIKRWNSVCLNLPFSVKLSAKASFIITADWSPVLKKYLPSEMSNLLWHKELPSTACSFSFSLENKQASRWKWGAELHALELSWQTYPELYDETSLLIWPAIDRHAFIQNTLNSPVFDNLA